MLLRQRVGRRAPASGCLAAGRAALGLVTGAARDASDAASTSYGPSAERSGGSVDGARRHSAWACAGSRGASLTIGGLLRYSFSGQPVSGLPRLADVRRQRLATKQSRAEEFDLMNQEPGLVRIEGCVLSEAIREGPRRTATHRQNDDDAPCCRYDDQGFQINEDVYTEGAVTCVGNLCNSWQVQSSKDLTVDSLAILHVIKPPPGIGLFEKACVFQDRLLQGPVLFAK